MAQSNTYQLSSRYETAVWKETLTPYFARHYPRRMMSEALFDSINQATSTKFDVCGVTSIICTTPAAIHYTKAMALPDPYLLFFSGRNYWQFLADFGQGDRDISERTTAPSLAQSMAMMNDILVLRGVRRSGATTVGAILSQTLDPNAITERLYLATLSRYPTEGERALATQYLRGGAVEDRAEDLQYVLLNKIEFLFN